MANVSQNTYLPGQRLRANTFFDVLLELKTTIPNLEAPLSVAANRDDSQITGPERSEDELDVSSFVIPPPAARAVGISSGTTLRPKQSWEGTVIESRNESFIARVSDRTNPLHPDEIVTFHLDEISSDDQPLVSPGASFYWTIGTEKSPAGTIKNVDMVAFRRLPLRKESSVREAEQAAKDLLNVLLA